MLDEAFSFLFSQQNEAVLEFGSRGRRPVDDSYDRASGS